MSALLKCYLDVPALRLTLEILPNLDRLNPHIFTELIRESAALFHEIQQRIQLAGFTCEVNPKFNPGLYGNLNTAEQVLGVIEDLYGRIPQTREAKLQEAQDRSVAESIAMNSTLYQFADQADERSRQIMDHAATVNPQGAAKLTAQSIAVLINVTTQVLRTNSMMLKMMGQDMAVSNRKGKLQSEQFKTQYEGLSEGMTSLPKQLTVSPLRGGG